MLDKTATQMTNVSTSKYCAITGLRQYTYWQNTTWLAIYYIASHQNDWFMALTPTTCIHNYINKTKHIYLILKLTASGFVRTSFIYSLTVIGPVKRIFPLSWSQSLVSGLFCPRGLIEWNHFLRKCTGRQSEAKNYIKLI